MVTKETTTVAVLGLYNSGSSLLANILRELGVNMGRELSEHFEPKTLTVKLQKWWKEPQLVPSVDVSIRVDGLNDWMERLRKSDPLNKIGFGAKHPLLVLSANDLQIAWGSNARFIWAWRPLENSISALLRRNWFVGREIQMQNQLWKEASKFFTNQPHLRVDYRRVCNRREDEVARIVNYLDLNPTNEQFAAAVGCIRSNGTKQATRLEKPSLNVGDLKSVR